jgi:Tfp pilus assembly PilM family ATPase
VAELLGVEPVLIETRVDSVKRLFALTKYGNIPSVLIDFKNDTVDISIVDRAIIATGTVSIGSNFGQLVEAHLHHNSTPFSEAPASGSESGAAAHGHEQPVNENQLVQFIKEIRRMLRYYEERYDKTHHIEQIVILGHETMLQSLVELMTDLLRLPVRTEDFLQLFSYEAGLTPIPEASGSEFIATAGLSIVPPNQVFK